MSAFHGEERACNSRAAARAGYHTAAAGERWLYLLVDGDPFKDEILGEARLERTDFKDGIDAEGGGTDDWK